MLKFYNILPLSRGKKLLLSLLFTGLTAFSFAGTGDGGKSKATASLHNGFTPVRLSSGFTLKAGPNYHGSMMLSEEKKADYIQFNSLITYQKGNTTYIVPYSHRVSVSAGKSNLQAINLKVRISH